MNPTDSNPPPYPVSYETGGFGGAMLKEWSSGGERLEAFFPKRTRAEVLAEIRDRTYPRAEISAELERVALTSGAPEASLRNIRRLNDANCFVIATGQQAGFLGGPLYTLYKALSVISLARKYEAEGGGAAFIPVFWVAGDDHDRDEIDHAWFHSENSKPVRVRAPLQSERSGISASELFLSADPPSQEMLRTQLCAFFPEAELAALLELYQGHSCEEAFARLLEKWLGPLGLVVARSSSLRRLGAGLAERNFADFGTVDSLIEERGTALRSAGYEPGFPEPRGGPHFYRHAQDGERQKLQPAGDRTFTVRSGERFGVDALANEIHKMPERFSAAAALRPVLQNTIFPVVAVVLGPGEIAYWAQLREVHAHYGAVWPVVVPRLTVTVLDERARKAVRKLGLEPCTSRIFEPPGEFKNDILKRGELAKVLDDRSREILDRYDALVEQIPGIPAKGLAGMIKRVRGKVGHQLSALTRRAVQAGDETVRADLLRVDTLANFVRPSGDPQERVYCCAQFVSRYPALEQELLKLDPERSVHWVLSV